MNAILERISAEQGEIEGFISTLMEQASVENRDLVATELDTVRKYEERMAELTSQAEPIIAFEARRASAVDISKVANTPARQTASLQVVETRSLGEIWTQSEQFRSYSGRGSSEVLHLPEYRAVGPDPLLTTTVPGKDLLAPPVKYRGPEHFVQHPLLDLCGRVEVTSNVVEFVVTSDATGADIVAEGAKKPPVVWNTTISNFTLQTIAGWFKYSRQSADDIVSLRDLVDQKIRRAIDNKLNALAVAALLAGKSAGNTVTGAARQPLIEVARLAAAALQDRGIMPSAVAVNPNDAAGIDIFLLQKTMLGAVGHSAIFGMPVIPVRDVPAGTVVVGSINDALTWFHKRGLSMYTTDSDVSDGAAGAVTSDFRSNILTTLGEVRGVFGVTDAQALEFGVVTP